MPTRAPVDFIDSPKKAKRAMDLWYRKARREPTACDTEFEPDGAITLMSLSWHSYDIRMVIEGGLVAEFFGEHLQDKRTQLIFQNYGADADVLYKIKVNCDKSLHADTMTMGWSHDENLDSHGLKQQSLHFLHWPRKEYHKLFCYVPLGKSKPIVMTPHEVLYSAPADALAVMDQAKWMQLMLEYSGDDAASTRGLYTKHRKYLEEIGYWENYLAIDVPFTVTLMRCQERGVRIDMKRLEAIRRLVGARIMRSIHSFRAVTGKSELNLNSGPQLQKLLIDELGWPVREDMLTKGGQPKLDREALIWYSDEHSLRLADVKLNYNRERTKEATFLKGIVTGISEDGRLRSHFNQIGADTGRISSRKQKKKITITYFTRGGEERTREKVVKVGANLQNIPSRKEKDPDGIRGAFVAPSKGQITARGFVAREMYKLIVADYSGFELCMMIYWTYAIKTRNKKMLGIMQKYKSPSACHAFTAINMYGPQIHKCDERCLAEESKWKHDAAKLGKKWKLGEVPMNEWKLVKKLFPDQYTLSKNNNFNLLFGGSAQMMARLRGLDWRDEKILEECEEQIEAWNKTYPEVPEYQRYMVKHGYDHGWIPTISDRRANVRELLEDPDKKVVGHGERKCMNTPCQGSAADIVKLAMNLIENDEELNSYRTGARRAVMSTSRMIRKGRKVHRTEKILVPAISLLFPVHDEIIVECPERYIEEATKRMVYLMKQPFKEKFPFELDVEAKSAVDWLSAKG